MKKTLAFALHRISYLNLDEKLRILGEFPTEKDFSRLTRFDLEWFLGRKIRCRSFAPARMLETARDDLENCEQTRTYFTFFGDPSYPSLLKEIYDPPLVLFWKGTLPPENQEALAVVGTRKPSLDADRNAFCLGMDAVRGKISLISGMAAGIDGAAHRGALAMSGKTWAVLGTGCDRPYPSAHHRLASEILSHGGGLVSEFFPGTGPVRYNFPKRNRIISGLSSKVIIVQAPRRSGALYTADFALEQGRDVYVHESGLKGGSGQGTRDLVGQGAEVLGLLKDIYPHIPDLYRGLQEPFGLQEGEAEDAGRMASRLMRKELNGSFVFYKGRMQSYG